MKKNEGASARRMRISAPDGEGKFNSEAPTAPGKDHPLALMNAALASAAIDPPPVHYHEPQLVREAPELSIPLSFAPATSLPEPAVVPAPGSLRPETPRATTR